MSISGILSVHGTVGKVDALENKIKSVKENLKVKSFEELSGRSKKVATQVKNMSESTNNLLKKTLSRTDLKERQRKRLENAMNDLDVLKAEFGLS